MLCALDLFIHASLGKGRSMYSVKGHGIGGSTREHKVHKLGGGTRAHKVQKGCLQFGGTIGTGIFLVTNLVKGVLLLC